MEIKKTQQITATDNPVTKKKAADFVTEMKGEVSKIQWTSKDELITYTKIVVGMTFVFGMAIYFTDLIIQGSLHALNGLLRLIGG
ncbi:MAG: preprotein translocase subunit SecE [Parachlamydiaceae bacterium]|nr:preprotein translocase subunit SecE [Parachlamydiaceae bacterium]